MERSPVEDMVLLAKVLEVAFFRVSVPTQEVVEEANLNQ